MENKKEAPFTTPRLQVDSAYVARLSAIFLKSCASDFGGGFSSMLAIR